MTTAAAAVLLLAALAAVASAETRELQSTAPDNVSSRLMIHIPHSLFREKGYDHREALFGMPTYGGHIAQNVYYAQSDLCDSNVDTSMGVPAREIDPGTGKMKPWPSPYLLMVNRGGCTFVQKVRNAQKSGAAGVLIADTTCLCSDQECLAKNGSTTCETQEPIMADDGSGGDISIPSFLMFKHDADDVIAELEANHPVQMEMAWSLPNPDDRVEYDLWTTPADLVSKDFLRSFKVIAEALGDRAYFTPHMYIYDGIRSHCVGNSGENFCYNLCTNNGRYCATDPDNDLEAGISGADVIKESLRRLCIWNMYGAANGIGKEWWAYVTEFEERCRKPEYFADDACIKDAYKHSKVDSSAIERCMMDSGGTDSDQTNSKLDYELSSQEQRGVVVIPTAFVNQAAIRGALNVNNMFSAICSGFLDGTMPEACMKCAGCQDPINCVQKGVCKSSKSGSSGGVSTSFFMFSMMMVVGGFGGFAAWHYKKTNDQMREQVRGILAEYMPLDDQDGAGAGGSFMGGGSPMNFAQGGATTSLIS